MKNIDLFLCRYVCFHYLCIILGMRLGKHILLEKAAACLQGYQTKREIHLKQIKFMKQTERTLVLLKPCTIKRNLIGEIISIFEKKGLRVVGLKMMQLTDEVLSEHYSHLAEKPFFQRVKDSMMATPVVAMCLEGVSAIEVVRVITGPTNGRTNCVPGTIRGMYCMSYQENIVHASDSPETAAVELKRFFKDEEIFDFPRELFEVFYANDEF